MTRATRLMAIGLLAGPLAAFLGAQGVPSQENANSSRYSALIRGLPPSFFDTREVGVRGMELAQSAKLDPRLRQLVDDSRRGTDVRARSLDLGAAPGDLRLPVLINAPDPGNVAAVTQEIRSLGGEVSASYDASVWALVPAAAVDRLAVSPNVHYLSAQDRMDLDQVSAPQDEMSQRATRIQGLQGSGIRGRGVKIGIIDSGFGGYSRLQKTGKVPAPKAARSFPSSRPLEGSSVHGAACAEIVYAMAPEASLYLAAIEPDQGSTVAAAQWLIAQGVDIISYSMGNIWQPGDGSGDLARFVDSTTVENGVLWIVSSGNFGMEHWSGANTDTDGDGLVETGKDSIGFEIVPQTDEVSVLVRWNDWGPNPRQPTSSQDIDAFLVMVKPDGSLGEVARSADRQSGGPGRPIEFIRFRRAGIKGQTFLLVLKNTSVSREVDLHVFIDSPAHAMLRPRTAARSVASPASARYALAVGAWEADTSQLASYSSQGPTDDNRLKPEVSAPAGIFSFAYAGRFDGTSASCPHAAGFAALVKQTNPELRGVALRAAVMRAVEPKGSPVPNTAFGFGWIDGTRIARTDSNPVSSVTPRPGVSPPVSATAASIVLPMAWGGAVRADVLDRLRQPGATPPAFLTRVTTGRDLYKVGDGLKVGFKTSESCDYLLFHRSSTGDYTLLSPRGGTIASLSAGGAYVLPADNETFEVTPPTGTEELLLVCARRALDLAVAAKPGASPSGLVVTRHSYQVSQ